MTAILIAILLLTESVVADQGLASREYKAASAEWSESEDRYLFCNTSTSSKQCKSPWSYCVEEDCNHCNLRPDNIFMCNDSIGQVNLLSAYCATFNNDTGYIETGACIYNEGHIHSTIEQVYTALPSNVSELNEFMCGKLFNRTGTLCGKCKDGHYPLVYSFDMNCVECPNGNSNWWKFLLVAFLPLTIFFYVIFFCRVNITSSALFGFVWYCQMAFDPGSIKVILLKTTNTHNVQKMVRLLGTFYEIWNLDFFRSLARGICLYGVDTLVAHVLNLAVGFYPLLLMVLTYFVIKLHKKGFRPFVLAWRPFSRIFQAVDTNKTSLIDAFVTFFLLTNVKFINISFDLLLPVKIFRMNATTCLNDTLGLFYDATVPYFGSRHLPYAILAITVLTIFVLMPILLLILYPFRWFQRLLNLFPFRWYILHTFMDSFYGCYKDGTQPGTHDCRWFASLFFIVRILIYVIIPFAPNLTFFPYAAMLLILFSILLFNVQPYKTGVEHYSTFNVKFILLLALLYTSCVGISAANERDHKFTLLFLLSAVFTAIFPILYLVTIFFHWMYSNNHCGLKLLIQQVKAKICGYEVLS